MILSEKPSLKIEVHLSSTLPKEVEQQIDVLDHMSFFEDGEEDFGNGIEWADSSHWEVLGWFAKQLVSRISVIKREIRIGDQTYIIGGIGGVATHPDWRRHGFARALMQAVEDLIRSEVKVDFGMLFCGEKMIPYYAHCGYIQVFNPLYILQKGQRLPFSDNKMVLAISGKAWPDGEVDVQGPPW
jgi:GNAT superfamily N-acetyltransferase